MSIVIAVYIVLVKYTLYVFHTLKSAQENASVSLLHIYEPNAI